MAIKVGEVGEIRTHVYQRRTAPAIKGRDYVFKIT